MSIGSTDRPLQAEPLSALVDGELPDAEVAPLCAAWRNDAELRRRWHAYQLIGDVLRSDDLAGDPAHDAAFVAQLRSRLAAEPVVLAPQALPRPARRRWGWRAPSAVAAGFAAVAGTVFVLQRPMLQPEPIAVAAPAAPVAVVPVAAAPASASRPTVEVAAESPTVISNPTIIRDARLDRYLSAHKQFAGSSALGAPSGYLRAATVDGAPR